MADDTRPAWVDKLAQRYPWAEHSICCVCGYPYAVYTGPKPGTSHLSTNMADNVNVHKGCMIGGRISDIDNQLPKTVSPVSELIGANSRLDAELAKRRHYDIYLHTALMLEDLGEVSRETALGIAALSLSDALAESQQAHAKLKAEGAPAIVIATSEVHSDTLRELEENAKKNTASRKRYRQALEDIAHAIKHKRKPGEDRIYNDPGLMTKVYNLAVLALGQ